MANMIELASYVAKFEADTSGIDTGFGKADANLKEKLGGMVNWSKVAIGGAIAGVVVGVGKLITDGVKATADLDENMSKFQATTGATDAEVEKVRKHAQELYKVNTDSMEDIIATSEAMKQAMGLTTEEIEGSQQAFMDFAKTTGQDNATVIRAIDDIGDAWGLSLDEMVGSTDMFKLSSEKFGTDIEGVQKAMQSLAPASKALGISFEETNGLMNMMAESGLDAGAAVTALNYAAKTVESPEQFRTMMEDIQAIKDPTERTQKAIELFGAKAGISMANVLDGSQSLDDFMITMEEAEGTVNSASDAFDSNFNVQLELAKKMFSGLTQELGDKFMPAINTGLKWVTDNMPLIEKVVTTTFDVIGGVFTFFIDIIKTVVETIKQFASDNEESLNGVQETFTSVFNGIMEFINGFIELFKTIWDKYGTDIVAYAKRNFEAVKTIIDGVLKIITGMVQAFTALLTGDWDKFGKALGTIISGAWKIIEGLFKSSINAVSGIFNGAISLLSGIAKTIMGGVWNAFKNVWDSIIGWIDTSFGNLGKTITGFGSKFFNAGKDIFNSMWDGLKNVWSGISNWVGDKVSWIADKLKFWEKSTDKMSNDPTPSKNSTSNNRGLPQYAVGTPFVPSDGLAYLHKGEAVIPAKYNPANNGSGFGGKSINIQQGNITLEVSGNVDRSLIPEMERMINNAIRKNGDKLIIELNKGGVFR